MLLTRIHITKRIPEGERPRNARINIITRSTRIAIRKKCYLILNTIQIRRSTAIRSRRYARVIRVRRIFKGRPIIVDTVNICTNQRKTSRQTRIRIARADY